MITLEVHTVTILRLLPQNDASDSFIISFIDLVSIHWWTSSKELVYIKCFLILELAWTYTDPSETIIQTRDPLMNLIKRWPKYIGLIFNGFFGLRLDIYIPIFGKLHHKIICFSNHTILFVILPNYISAHIDIFLVDSEAI